MSYEDIVVSIQAVLDPDAGAVANLANIAALLTEYLENVNWAGFYLLRGDELILGPFSGKVACVRIKVGKGVCGTAVKENRTLIVKDVFTFPGHIACDADSRAEIVIPLRNEKGEPIGVMDLDSNRFGRFAEADAKGLALVAGIVEPLLRTKSASKDII